MVSIPTIVLSLIVTIPTIVITVSYRMYIPTLTLGNHCYLCISSTVINRYTMYIPTVKRQDYVYSNCIFQLYIPTVYTTVPNVYSNCKTTVKPLMYIYIYIYIYTTVTYNIIDTGFHCQCVPQDVLATNVSEPTGEDERCADHGPKKWCRPAYMYIYIHYISHIRISIYLSMT
jgi:hypothetical protein